MSSSCFSFFQFYFIYLFMLFVQFVLGKPGIIPGIMKWPQNNITLKFYFYPEKKSILYIFVVSLLPSCVEIKHVHWVLTCPVKIEDTNTLYEFGPISSSLFTIGEFNWVWTSIHASPAYCVFVSRYGRTCFNYANSIQRSKLPGRSTFERKFMKCSAWLLMDFVNFNFMLFQKFYSS